MRNFPKRFMTVALLAGAFTLTATACDKNGGGGGKAKTARGKWVDKPSRGSQSGRLIKIPGLNVTFETPDVLYVYKECAEAAHSPDDSDSEWIPVIRCDSRSGDDEDEYGLGGDEDSEALALTIYATKKERAVNERTVTIMETEYTQAGFVVDSIGYIEDYQSKEGRRGIEAKIHLLDSDNRYPTREIMRFMFPVDDVLFIAHVDYPYGDDRSGILSDWQRILWNFQLDEDGPLYPGQGQGGGEEEPEESEDEEL